MLHFFYSLMRQDKNAPLLLFTDTTVKQCSTSAVHWWDRTRMHHFSYSLDWTVQECSTSSIHWCDKNAPLLLFTDETKQECSTFAIHWRDRTRMLHFSYSLDGTVQHCCYSLTRQYNNAPLQLFTRWPIPERSTSAFTNETGQECSIFAIHWRDSSRMLHFCYSLVRQDKNAPL